MIPEDAGFYSFNPTISERVGGKTDTKAVSVTFQAFEIPPTDVLYFQCKVLVCNLYITCGKVSTPVFSSYSCILFSVFVSTLFSFLLLFVNHQCSLWFRNLAEQPEGNVKREKVPGNWSWQLRIHCEFFLKVRHGPTKRQFLKCALKEHLCG